ncbi:hypothetical protein [Salinicola sp. MH3R3-1]|uniref:hypothetical protein n=1 Tax=Salinicola sp. MH3R3-1 TaxID=1928762 RepID=UPI000A6EA12C|nr:hypothetical protein [Salinicola sp. MH3R3-1]
MPELRVALLAVTVRITNRIKSGNTFERELVSLPTTPLDRLKQQTGSLLQAMHKVIPGNKLPIAPVLVFPDTREWHGTFPELTLKRTSIFKGDLTGLCQAQLTALFKNTA